jgi:hypothetical protein
MEIQSQNLVELFAQTTIRSGDVSLAIAFNQVVILLCSQVLVSVEEPINPPKNLWPVTILILKSLK